MFPLFLLRYFSSITTSYNNHSFLYCSLLIIYSHLQILSLFCVILPQTHEYKSRVIIFLDLVLLKNTTEIFPNCFKLVLICIGFTILWEIRTCIRKTKSIFSKWYFQYAEQINPILLSLSYQEINTSNQNKAFHFLFLSFLVVFWFLKIFFVAEDPKSKNWRVSKRGQYAHLIFYCMLSIFNIISKNSQSQQFKLWQLFRLIIIPIFIIYRMYLSTKSFEYLDERIEYVQFVCRVAELFFIFCMISSIYLGISLHFLTLSVLAFIVIERLGCFKLIFELKYNRIIDSLFYLTKQEDAILIIYLLCRQEYDNEWIQFDFYKKLKEIKHKLIKEIRQETFLQTEQNSPAMNLQIKKYICRNFNRKKSNHLLGYLAYFHLEHHMYIRALRCSAEIQNNGIESYLTLCSIKQRLKQFSNIYLKSDIQHNSQNQKICKMITKKEIINVQTIQQLQSYLKKWTQTLIELSDINSNLLVKLNEEEIYQTQVGSYLQKQTEIKYKLDQQRRNNLDKLKSQDILVLTYIYISYYCCKQSEANTLQPLFYQLRSRYHSRCFVPKSKMICFVSGKQDQIGRILLANNSMITQLSLSRDRIKYKQQHIDHYMPFNIASKHTRMISDYIDRGTSTFIGKQKQLYLVLNGITKSINLTVQLYHNIDKIIFSCVMEILNQKEIILLSENSGGIIGYSSQASKLFGIKSFDSCNDIKDYLPTSRLNSGKQFNEKWIEHIKVKNLVYKIITDTITHKYFTMKVYKLVLVDERNIQSNMKLSINLQKKTKQILSTIISSGRKTTITNQHESKFDQRIQRIYQLKFSDKKFICLKTFWIMFILFLFSVKTLTDVPFKYVSDTCMYTNKFVGRIQLEMQTKSPYLILRNQRIINNIYNQSTNHQKLGQFFGIMMQTQQKVDYSEYLLIPSPPMQNTNLIELNNLLSNIPQSYVSIISEPIFTFHTPTLIINMSILTLCSYFQTFSQQLDNYNMTQFYYDWKANEMKFLNLQRNQVPKMINSMDGRILGVQLVYAISATSVLLFIIYFLALRNLGQLLRLPTELLAKVQNIIWRQRIQRNAYLKNVIQKIYQNSVYRTQISKPTASQQKIQLQSDYFNVFQQIVHVNDKPKKNAVKKFKTLNFTKKRYYHLFVVIVCLIPVLAISLTFCKLIKSSFQILNFGVEFNESILRSYMLSNRLLDTINLYSIDKTLLTQKTDQQVIAFAETLEGIFKTIYFQDTFKKFKIDWDSQQQFLYNNRCQQQDKLCQSLLSGSLLQGFLTSCTSLISKSVIVLKKMIQRGTNIGIQNQMNELFVFYKMYMYNIFNDSLQFSQNYVQNTILRYQQIFKNLSLSYLAVIVIIALLLFKRMIRNVRMIKQGLRQTFTILPLSKIKEIRQFEFQLMRITN